MIYKYIQFYVHQQNKTRYGITSISKLTMSRFGFDAMYIVNTVAVEYRSPNENTTRITRILCTRLTTKVVNTSLNCENLSSYANVCTPSSRM